MYKITVRTSDKQPLLMSFARCVVVTSESISIAMTIHKPGEKPCVFVVVDDIVAK